MKNCEVTIITKVGETTTSIRYQFDDFRIAAALVAILDNVGEPHIEGDTDYFEWLPIYKEQF